MRGRRRVWALAGAIALMLAIYALPELAPLVREGNVIALTAHGNRAWPSRSS